MILQLGIYDVSSVEKWKLPGRIVASPGIVVRLQGGVQAELELVAAVEHIGVSMCTGHYVAYRRVAVGGWRVLNDSGETREGPAHGTILSQPEFAERQMYLCLYARVEASRALGSGGFVEGNGGGGRVSSGSGTGALGGDGADNVHVSDANAVCESSGSGGQRWMRFTPTSIDGSCCLARTWSKGFGGQCPYKRLSGCELCKKHSREFKEGGLSHGRVDGDIPEAKFKEFEKVAKSSGGRRTQNATGGSASDAVGSESGGRLSRAGFESAAGSGGIGEQRVEERAPVAEEAGEGSGVVRRFEPEVGRGRTGRRTRGQEELGGERQRAEERASAAVGRVEAEEQRGIGDLGRARQMAARAKARADLDEKEKRGGGK